ncbi:hypothetical protein [Planomicrobium okeanokoites]|uniref:hypothetical protein n=1 Tax=Planomicrobium okeanokoites TaxID=244 RepID=UPI0024904B3D|nr:hypothetical protein [Planomicrobium okeanokoites]
MKCKGSIFLLLISIFLLAGCQSAASDGQVGATAFNVVSKVTEIEIRTWHGDVHINTITDKAFIEQLVDDLENAEINSTATVDWAGPDFKVLFKNENRVLYELGYCDRDLNFGDGATGRYWENDQLYKVNTDLPVD